jgi:hypothetical protein
MTFWKQCLLSIRVEQPAEKQVQHSSIVQVEPVNGTVAGLNQEDRQRTRSAHIYKVTNVPSVANVRIRVSIKCIDGQVELHVSVVTCLGALACDGSVGKTLLERCCVANLGICHSCRMCTSYRK